MTEQDERQKAFQDFKEEVLVTIANAQVRVDEEVHESVEFARTYTELREGIKSVLVSKGVESTPYNLLRKDLWVFEKKASDILRDIEAEYLGIDLTAVV